MLVGGRTIATSGASFYKYTPYQRAQITRYRMQQATQQTLNTMSAFSNKFFSAKVAHSQGLASLSAQAAIQRSENELLAKKSQLVDITA